MSNFHKERLTLEEMMLHAAAHWKDGAKQHIVYNPSADFQYDIVRQSSHDGTSIFTTELFQSVMVNLFKSLSYYKPMGECPDDYTPLYTVGTAQWSRVFGDVDLPCGRYPGLRERVRILVKCEYVKIGELS